MVCLFHEPDIPSCFLATCAESPRNRHERVTSSGKSCVTQQPPRILGIRPFAFFGALFYPPFCRIFSHPFFKQFISFAHRKMQP